MDGIDPGGTVSASLDFVPKRMRVATRAAMKKYKFTDEQSIQMLRLTESVTTVVDLCRKVGVSEQTF
jgi:hypothetical protein